MGNTKYVDNLIPNKRVIPLGVSRENGYIFFSVSVMNAKECKLLLYLGLEKEPSRVLIKKQSEAMGNVYTFWVKEEELVETSYLYEANGITFIDPYATGITKENEFGYVIKEEDKKNLRGTWSFECFDWKEDKNPIIPYTEMILYKLHVRGFTMHPNSFVKHKGTYLGLTEKISYLKELGINAVLLMPCTEYEEISEEKSCFGVPTKPIYQLQPDNNKNNNAINEGGKINYWGYSKALYFSPKAAFAFHRKEARDEFKTMVREFHKNGIEVLMEFYFENGTPQHFILDCLRFWAFEYHVDGFRLVNDIKGTLIIAADPYLAQTKLIASNWNTEEIYEREICPEFKNLADFNTVFLFDTRKFLKGDEEQLRRFAENFKQNSKKKGTVNLICDTNGFTLADLYSYDRKHNELNGENNKDGTDYNFSWNCGVEGATKSKKIKDLRLKMMKNALSALLLSRGTPMLLSGDEFANSQSGNNNAYCQDNEIGWVDWKKLKQNVDFFSFTKKIITLRKTHKVLCNELELKELDYISCGYPDISFHGTKAWCPEFINYSRTLGILLCGYYAVKNHTEVDNFFYIAFNMHWEEHSFDLPDLPRGMEWVEEYDTSEQGETRKATSLRIQNPANEKSKELSSSQGQTLYSKTTSKNEISRKQVILKPRSIVVFKSRNQFD